MKNVLKAEELMMLVVSVVAYQSMGWAWYWYWVWFLTPDISMFGYLVNARVGAVTYNLAHHKGLAIVCGLAGFWLNSPYLLFGGILLFGHAAFDRILGYGLKHFEGFAHTHLGIIGKDTSRTQ